MKEILKGGFLVTVAACLLSGCGGGGGGTAAPTVTIDPNLTVPLQKAIANLVNNGMNKSFSLAGTIDQSTPSNKIPLTPINGSGNLTLGTPSAATFNGSSVMTATEVITGTMTVNGQLTPIASTATIYYDPSNYTIIGTVDSTGTAVMLPLAYPASVKAGSTGSLGTGSGSNGSITIAYTVTSDSASSLLATVLQTTTNGLTSAITKSQTTYRVDTSGGISLVTIAVQKIFLGSVYETLTYTF